MALPSDPIMLLSVVNLETAPGFLASFQPSTLLCVTIWTPDRTPLCKALFCRGLCHDAARNQFI